MKDILFKLLEIPSISGDEEALVSRWHSMTGKLCDRSWIDDFGNGIGVVNEGAEISILINAHCDEIGLITTKIEDNGTIRFKGLGTDDAAVLYGQRVKILGLKTIAGLVQSGKKQDKKDPALKIEDLLIDIGSSSKKETEKLLNVGSYIQLDSEPAKLLNGTVMAKGLDDKAGLAVMYEIMKKIKKERIPGLTIYFAATLREEINSGGAITLASCLKPDYSISIDVAETNDISGSKSNDCTLELGKGPIILRCPLLSRKLENLLSHAAVKSGIKIQREATPHFSYTDADEIHRVKRGIPSTVLSIPIRYIHTANEIISMKDLDSTAKLTFEFLKELAKSGEKA